jgi:hypothetical protein
VTFSGHHFRFVRVFGKRIPVEPALEAQRMAASQHVGWAHKQMSITLDATSVERTSSSAFRYRG